MKDLETMEDVEGGMSNLDGAIDAGFEARLRASPNTCYGQHAAWNFCGYVWFNGDGFTEQVWRYRVPIEEISAPTLEGLMGEVNSRYGSA